LYVDFLFLRKILVAWSGRWRLLRGDSANGETPQGALADEEAHPRPAESVHLERKATGNRIFGFKKRPSQKINFY